MDWEFGISTGKLLYIGWINNKVLLYALGGVLVANSHDLGFMPECYITYVRRVLSSQQTIFYPNSSSCHFNLEISNLVPRVFLQLLLVLSG